jgi:hypothetical protein
LITGFAIALSILTVFAAVLLVGANAAPKSVVWSTDTLSVYSDSACTQTLTSISWGKTALGDSVSRIVYIKNSASYGQRLSLSTINWVPTLAGGLVDVSWNLENARLGAGQEVAAFLTLQVSPDAGGLTNFNFELLITGTSNGR